ncbi:uncharacterized protein LOC121374298 [Gigantopelta aegis]|uniref:uncharacterized protein LOC121374298 n=1 Tax=Gigantopelta aegis TaxID=1735272 RepID=UPI001B88C0E8|nr:uncharacterized protein LOC121374298 [Gigantopelta aegis]
MKDIYFNQINQKPGEAFESYFAALKYLAKISNFGVLHESLIRDCIVLGVQDNTTRKRLLQERKRTLKTSSDICTSDEATCTQMGAIAAPPEEINKLKTYRRNPAAFKQRHVLQKKLCPAWGKSCLKCRQMEHFAVKCRQTKVHHIDERYISDDSDSEVIQTTGDGHKTVFVKMKVTGKPIKFQIDCGSTVNILPRKFVRNIKIKQTELTLRMWNKSNLTTLGTCRQIIRNPANRERVTLFSLLLWDKICNQFLARELQNK